MPPYWPWVQAIRSYMRDTDPEQLRSEMGAGAADIAEIVSDVREQFPDLPTPQLTEPEQARFKLHDAITAFLKNASQKQPIMLVLDDIHWSDTPSLLPHPEPRGPSERVEGRTFDAGVKYVRFRGQSRRKSPSA